MCLSSAPVYNFELLHFQLKTICLKGSGSFFQHFWQCIRWELFFCNIYAGVPYHRVAEAHLRLAAQPHIGPKWTISRSEQYPEGPYMYSPWSELCPKFVQGMWARWTLSEQIWWSNRDPWALGSCFEIICFEFSCIDLGGPALFNIQMQDFLIKHVICTPGYDLSRESFQIKGLSSWSFLVYRGALYAVTLFLGQSHCKVFKSAWILICRQGCFMTCCHDMRH